MGDKYEYYNLYDLPIPYKGLDIYPVLMADYWDFWQFAPVLLLDIYSPPILTPEIAQMKFLEYYFYEKNPEGKQYYLPILAEMLRIVFRDKERKKKIYPVVVEGNPYLVIRWEEKESVIDKHDFEKIRGMIISQNLLNPPNPRIQKELRDSMREAKEIREKMRGIKHASLEDQIATLCVGVGITFDDVWKMTYRKFSKLLERFDNNLHYQIYKTAMMSGMVKFKDTSFIKHPLANLERDEFSELLSYDSVEKQYTGGNSL